MNCKTCKHWKQEMVDFWDEDAHEPVEPFLGGNSATGKPSPAWGECQIAKGSDGKALITETLVFAHDCSSYAAGMSTEENFGCVLHENI